jgi:hypothetical protein
MHDLARGQPAYVDQGLLAIELDQYDGREGHDRHGEQHAEPGCLEPPIEPAHHEDDGNAAEADGEQQVAENVGTLNDLGMRHRRQGQQIDDRQRDQRERHLERVQPVPLSDLDELRRDQPRDRSGQGRACQGECEAHRQLSRRWKGFQHIEKAEGRHRRGRNAADEADDDRRMKVRDEDVHQ